VDEYRRLKNTAVLTIMFTDIQGFTEFTERAGEARANEFRRRHDEILHNVVESGQAGRVIKHIGDAVMAVFSEPSRAVECALKIQEAIRQLDPGGEEKELRVRIGLHMGQVTIEDQVAPDVFGRHVNRASRVESLAPAGRST